MLAGLQHHGGRAQAVRADLLGFVDIGGTVSLLSTGSGFPGVDAAAVASIARPADLTVFVLAA